MYERKEPTKEQKQRKEKGIIRNYTLKTKQKPKTDPLITKISKYKFEILHLKRKNNRTQLVGGKWKNNSHPHAASSFRPRPIHRMYAYSW